MITFIKTIIQYIKIVRPVNVAITGCAVLLGAVVALDSHGVAFKLAVSLPLVAVSDFRAAAAIVFFLGVVFIESEFVRTAISAALAAMFAAAYGNVINDIIDIKSDRISHPDRPLASGRMSIVGASIFAALLAVFSLICALLTSSAFHFLCVIAVLVLLTLYSKYFKRMPIVGNIVVALLTAYALLYGALPHPETKIIIVPAILAFLLNFCRELVKDVQDAAGDGAAGWRTSAVLSEKFLKGLLAGAGGLYMVLLFLPSAVFGDFGTIYNVICLAFVLPIHVYWLMLVLKFDIEKKAGRIGTVLKLEMVAGLLAIGGDKFF